MDLKKALCTVLFFSPGFFCFPENIVSGKISVTVNQIPEIQISRQLEEMLRTELNENEDFFKNISKENQEEENLVLDLSVNQRQFYKNIDNLNSIYVHAELYNKDGNRIMEDGFYSETKNSIISSVRQKKEIDKVIKGIKKYISKKQKENTEADVASVS